MESKICALIRQTWYETAKKNLTPEERVRFYETCLEFEFYGHEPAEDIPFGARLLFDMVRNDIENDRQRIAERAERARRNGMTGGRPKVTEDNKTNENPKKPSGILANLITKQNKTEQNKTEQECEQEENEDTHMFFLVCLDFFARGCADPVGVANTFWNYYAAQGWKTKGGAEVVDRLALARAWRLSDISAAAIKRRAAWVDMLRYVKTTEVRYISEFVEIVKSVPDKQVTLTLQTRELCMLFEHSYVAGENKTATEWFRKWAPGYSFEYRALQEHL